MFNSMFDELKEVKYFKEIIDFKNLKCKILWRKKAFKDSSKSRGVFRTQGNIYDGAFLWIYLRTYYFQ